MRESTKLIGNTPMLRLENTNIYKENIFEGGI